MKHLLLFLSLFAALRAAEPIIPPLFSGSVSTDYVSSYTFRGTKLAADSIQPSATLNVGSFYGTVWASQPIRKRANEVDYTLGGGVAGLDAGITAYTYPHGGASTYEPYVGYSREVGIAKASIYTYRDLTLRLTTFETKLAAKVLTVWSFDGSLEGSLGTVQGRATNRYVYWSVGPVLRCKLTEDVTASVGVQWTSTSIGGSERVWASRASLSWGF